MGGIAGLVGLSNGAAGTSFGGPQGANILNPTTMDQIQTSYGQVQKGLGNQNDLLSAIQAQNGLGNQSNVYNQLQGVVSGAGPNPAQDMLNQQTGQNVANQAALMAGQRGASANAGLLARQAAQQGAATQQQAVGQGATLQAQQSLNALGQAGTIANTQAANQIGQTNANIQAQQAEQQNLIGAQGAFNNAQVGMQANVNNVNGQLANTQMQGQQALLGGLINGGGAAGMLKGAEGGEIPSPGGFPDVSTPTFGSDAGAAALGGDGGGGGGGILKLAALMAPGGQVSPIQMQAPAPISGPQSSFGQFLMGSAPSSGQAPDGSAPAFGPDSGADALYKATSAHKKTTQDPGEGSSGETQAGDMSSHEMDMSGIQGGGAAGGMEFSRGGNVGSKLKSGGHVPGKPRVPGNSYSNDTVKALLSPGEVVIPNNVMQSKNPVDGAARFVAAVLAKKRGKK